MPRRLAFFLVTVVSIALLAAPVRAQSGDAAASQIRLGHLPPGVSIHQLDNGLRVLLIEHPNLPMTGVNVVIKVGSAYETFATSGMSHMLEHLLFNGTEARTQEELYAQVDRLGAYNNANTGTYYTNFMMVASNDKILEAMEIQADMLFHSVLPPEKFDKEQGIVLEEIAKSLADPKEQIERACLDFLYAGHALSLPTLGTYATISAMSRDGVYAFYKNHYVPNNMIMSVVGDFEPHAMLEAVKSIYGAAAPANVARREYPDWRVGADVPTRPAMQATQAHRFYDGDGVVIELFFDLPKDEPPAFFELLDQAIDDQLPDLQKAMEQRFPDCIHSVTALTRPTPISAFAEFSVTLKGPAPLEDVTQALVQQIQSRRFDLPQATVTAMATRTRTDFLKNIEKPHMFGIYNAYPFSVGGIESVLASYDTHRFDRSAQALAGLDFSHLPVRLLVHHPMTPSQDSGTTGRSQTTVFDEPDSNLHLLVTQSPGSGLLAVHYLVGHKAYFESQFGKDAARILHDCLSQRLESPENQRLSERFGLTYTLNDNPFIPMDNIYLHPDFAYLRIEGLADDVPAAIAFLNEQIGGFTPSEKEYAAAVAGFKKLEHPMGRRMGSDAFDRAYKDLIFEPPPYAPPEEQVTFEGLSAFARSFFHPANMIVAVTSPESPEHIRDFFLPWAKSAEPMTTPLPKPYQETLKLRSEENRIEKNIGGAQSHLFYGFIKPIDAEDRAAVVALGLILGDRIVFDIREKQGMAYNMSAGIDLNQDRALFFVKVPTRTINVDALTPQFPGFFDSRKIADISQDELTKAVNQYLGRVKFRRLSSINQAYYRSHDYYFTGDAEFSAHQLDALATVTLDEVKRAAQKYLHPEHAVTVVMR